MEFANLARTFEELERTSSRLSLIELVTQLFRSIEQPEEIQQVCYLMQGRVAPFYEALEMGMAEKSVTKAIALASHSTPEQIEALYGKLGDLGLVAEQVRNEAKDAPSPLSIDDVFEELRAIAHTSGKGAVESKSARLVSLLRQVDSVSARYVVRILLGKLRMGIGDATVLDALAKVRWNDAKKRKLLEGAYHKISDLGLIARTLWEHPEEEEAAARDSCHGCPGGQTGPLATRRAAPYRRGHHCQNGDRGGAVQVRRLARTDPQGWRARHHLLAQPGGSITHVPRTH